MLRKVNPEKRVKAMLCRTTNISNAVHCFLGLGAVAVLGLVGRDRLR